MSRADFLRQAGQRAATVVGALAAGLVIDEAWRRAVRGPHLEREDPPRFVIGGLRVHHNVVGYGLILVGLFRHPWALIPMGLGMIVGHARRDRLIWFVERVG